MFDRGHERVVIVRLVPRPESPMLAAFILSCHLVFPAVALAIGHFEALPDRASIDWSGQSSPARFLNAMLFLQLLFATGTVFIMRGRRLVATVAASIAFIVTLGINMWAYMKVTGIYL